MRAEMERDPNTLFLVGTYSIGKERVLEAVAKAAGSRWVHAQLPPPLPGTPSPPVPSRPLYQAQGISDESAPFLCFVIAGQLAILLSAFCI